MLVDPLVLKKKLDRMATEQGAFAVLSSLLLYVTELAASDPQLSNKRTKWAEGKENKVSYSQPCPDANRGQYPTRFQLLRARFLNNNREPYTKKRREVGKLVIKEKLWVSRAGNKLDRSRDRKGDGKAAEEDADIVPSERARWSSVCGKNTVKNILKKFLAAEEKEAKENSPIWKKEPKNGLPKIVNKSSVLSKLKEQFEQSTLRSAAEVKASLSCKGEKKTKNFLSRKTIRKPEVRVLRTAAMTATDINNPESQFLVCSTVPVPRLSMATKINHPWSWLKNSTAKQPFGHGTPLKEKGGSDREPDENNIPANAAQDREHKEELPVAPKVMSDAKDCAETKIDSAKQGPNFNPNLDSSSITCKNKALADCVPPLSECSLDCENNNVLAGPDKSLLGVTSAVQHVKEDTPPSNSPYSSTAEESYEPSPQDTKTGEIPKITMYVYSSEEADTELTEPEKNAFFTGQERFSEQKALENILPLHSSGVRASCEVEPPMDDQQLTVVTPASGKRPLIAQKEAPDLVGRCPEEAEKEVKYHSEDKISSISSNNYSDVPTKKEEKKTPNSQMQNESKSKQKEPLLMDIPQHNFVTYHGDISNPDADQIKHTLSLNESKEQKSGAAEEEQISSHLENTQSPLAGDLVKHHFYIAEEDFRKDKSSSSNEMINHANNQALHRSTFTDLETCYKPSKSFIECEEATADEMPWPDSEACKSLSSTLLPTPVRGIAGQRIHYTFGNPPALPPIDLARQGADGVGDEHASHSHEKHPPPSSDELANHGNDTQVEEKNTCDFKSTVLSPNHATEKENSTAEETNTCGRFDNCHSLSTRKPGKHENKTTLTRRPLLTLEKSQTPTSDDTTKQESDMLEKNLSPSSTEPVSDKRKHVKVRNKVSEHTKDKLLSSDDDIKHENDKIEAEYREERNVLHKPEDKQVFTPSDTVDHDNNSSNEKNAQRPQTSQLPSSKHDNNIQGMQNTGQSLKHLTPFRDFVKHKHDMTVDENICCNNGKHQLSSSDEPMKHANDSAVQKNIKSNFKNNSTPPRNTSRQNSKTTDGENTPHNSKNEPMEHKKSCEGERNTSCDPKYQIPSPSPLVKQDKKSPPLETQKQMSPGDFVEPETKSTEKKTKHTSEKLQTPSPNKVLKPQERSSPGDGKQKSAAAEANRSPETKVVKEDNEHQCSGNYQPSSSRKSAKHEENITEGEKQQKRPEDLAPPDTNAAREKNKFPISRKYRSVSSEILVKPQEKNTQEKNTPKQQQQTSASAGFKKSDSNAVKEKDGDPNPEKSPSLREVVKSQDKNTSGHRKQKSPAAEASRSPETNAVKEDNEHQCSGNYQPSSSRKSAKHEENITEGEKQQKRPEDLVPPDTNAASKKNKFPVSGRSVSSETWVTPQEKNTQEKNTPKQQQQTSASAGFKKSDSNAVKEKDGDPNPEKSPSPKEVVKSRDKNTSGDGKQKSPASEDIRSPEAKAVERDDKYRCSGNHELPPSSKPSKSEKNASGGEKQHTVSFTKSDASAVKGKSKDPGSGMCQSPSSNLLVKPQERNSTVTKKQLPPPRDEKTRYKTGSGPERREKYQLSSSAQSERPSSDGSEKEGPAGNFKSYQAPLPSDGMHCKTNTLPKETSLSPKSSSFHVASKEEENPNGNRKSQPGFKKYQALSSKNLERHEKDVAETEESLQAAGKTTENCAKAASLPKYTAESYSERPLDSSFKPLIIRVIDTFKHHS